MYFFIVMLILVFALVRVLYQKYIARFKAMYKKIRIPTDRMTCLEGRFTQWGACGYDSKFTLVAQGGLQPIWLLPKLENHECGMVESESLLDSTRRVVGSWLGGG